MRRICPKCGSEIPEGELSCPVCREIDELDKKNRRKMGMAVYAAVVAAAAVFAALLLTSGIRDFSVELENA